MREDPRRKFRQGVAEFPCRTGIRARMRRRLRNWPLARKLAALVVVGCVLIGAVFAAEMSALRDKILDESGRTAAANLIDAARAARLLYVREMPRPAVPAPVVTSQS